MSRAAAFQVLGDRMRIDISDDDMHGAVGVGWGGSSGTDHVQRFMLLEIYTLSYLGMMKLPY